MQAILQLYKCFPETPSNNIRFQPSPISLVMAASRVPNRGRLLGGKMTVFFTEESKDMFFYPRCLYVSSLLSTSPHHHANRHTYTHPFLSIALWSTFTLQARSICKVSTPICLVYLRLFDCSHVIILAGTTLIMFLTSRILDFLWHKYRK